MGWGCLMVWWMGWCKGLEWCLRVGKWWGLVELGGMIGWKGGMWVWRLGMLWGCW